MKYVIGLFAIVMLLAASVLSWRKHRDYKRVCVYLISCSVIGGIVYTHYVDNGDIAYKSERSGRPNVVIFYADDLGWGDLSINNGATPTPNIDRIFSEGIRFDNFATTPVCSPSRAGLLTGRHYVGSKQGPKTAGKLPLEETTIAESFKRAGYATGFFGKWHNGHGVNAHGFDRFFGFYGGAREKFIRPATGGRGAWYHDRKTAKGEEGYSTDLITQYALEFIQKNRKKPFFCFIPYGAVHAPLQAKYEDILLVPESVRKGESLLTQEEYEDVFTVRDGYKRLSKVQQNILYSAMLVNLDVNIGQVVNYLEENGLQDNTIIFFASDNGASRYGSNLPLRGGKHTLYEGGIRVPAAMWWKSGKVLGGRKVKGDFGYLDVYPTLSSLAGIERRQGLPLDGRDLSNAILAGNEFQPTEHHWLGDNTGAVKDGRWKLIYDLQGMQLYDLWEDVGESRNLASEKPEIVQSLKTAHENWLKEANVNPSYAVPPVGIAAKPAPDGEVLEIYAEQTGRIQGPKRAVKIPFAKGYGKKYVDPVSPGDVIEYDIYVAEDGRPNGFIYSPMQGRRPLFLKGTGYDQYGRLQSSGPAPEGGKGVWEHRVVGIGNLSPLPMHFNMVCLVGKEPGTYHFYLDNVVARKQDGSVVEMWTDSSDTFKQWNEDPFMVMPDKNAFENVELRAVPLSSISRK